MREKYRRLGNRLSRIIISLKTLNSLRLRGTNLHKSTKTNFSISFGDEDQHLGNLQKVLVVSFLQEYWLV